MVNMWQTENNQLYKKFTFKDFNEAFGFLRQVAKVAEASNHHPKITNQWNVVELWLSTHEARDIVTEKDIALSKAIDEILEIDEPVSHEVSSKQRAVKLFGDGGSRGNPGPSAIGYVLLDMEDNILLKNGVYLGITTNNQAEYQSLKLGLEEAFKMGAQEVAVHMDSMLVVNQMKGIFKVKNRDLWPIHEAIKESAARFKKVTYTHVPREFNKLADGEVNATLDKEAGDKS